MNTVPIQTRLQTQTQLQERTQLQIQTLLQTRLQIQTLILIQLEIQKNDDKYKHEYNTNTMTSTIQHKNSFKHELQRYPSCWYWPILCGLRHSKTRSRSTYFLL